MRTAWGAPSAPRVIIAAPRCCLMKARCLSLSATAKDKWTGEGSRPNGVGAKRAGEASGQRAGDERALFGVALGGDRAAAMEEVNQGGLLVGDAHAELEEPAFEHGLDALEQLVDVPALASGNHHA